MSAGAGGDVLGYPSLPDEFHHASHRSTLLHHRSSVRSAGLLDPLALVCKGEPVQERPVPQSTLHDLPGTE